MSLLEMLPQRECWERFYTYKTSLACAKSDAKELRDFIDSGGYLPVCAAIANGEPFPLPGRAVISKLGVQKKRVVYIYPPAENTVLKLLTYLLLRRYDRLFCGNLYSFRPAHTANDAVRRLKKLPNRPKMYAYKVDISNYFNSVPMAQFLPMLDAALGDDPALCAFLRRLLECQDVLENGRVITEEHGIMAGTPLSAFYANLYLRALDGWFYERQIPYARYSDDIIVLSESRSELDAYASRIRGFLAEHGLTVNPAKECFTAPDEGFCFLGYVLRGQTVDIAPASVIKMKQKMRRKTRALRRWQHRNELDGEKAAAAFIRVFNSKLFEAPEDNSLSWCCWYFPVITTAESLQIIDRYAQDCIRYLISGTHTKSRYNVRYADLKRLGYRSLVNAYYAHTAAEQLCRRQQTDAKDISKILL